MLHVNPVYDSDFSSAGDSAEGAVALKTTTYNLMMEI
jgi:hypothetical protein